MTELLKEQMGTVLKKWGIDRPGSPQNVVMVGDFGKDLDDEHALILATALHRLGVIRLLAVVGNLRHAELRARIAKGTLKQLRLEDIPVLVGEEVVEGEAEIHSYEKDIPYLAKSREVEHRDLGDLLMSWNSVQEIALVLQSGLTDAADLVRRYPMVFRESKGQHRKISSAAIMGGVQSNGDKVRMTGKYFQPDSANNLTFDWASGVWLYARLQELGIPMTITTRHAAYATPFFVSLYGRPEWRGSPVGRCLRGRAKESLQKLWEGACSPEGSEIRGTLPPRNNRAWFLEKFCGVTNLGIEDGGDIRKYLWRFNLYDPINLVGAVDVLRERFFNPEVVRVGETEHRVVGVSGTNHGVKDIEGLREFVTEWESWALTYGEDLNFLGG